MLQKLQVRASYKEACEDNPAKQMLLHSEKGSTIPTGAQKPPAYLCDSAWGEKSDTS